MSEGQSELYRSFASKNTGAGKSRSFLRGAGAREKRTGSGSEITQKTMDFEARV